MPSGNAFRASNRAQMNSNVYTTQEQGGGAKKAGFPYIVGRTSWTNIAFQTYNPIKGTGITTTVPCASLACLMTTKLPLACVSRPIGGQVQFNTYWKCPST